MSTVTAMAVEHRVAEPPVMTDVEMWERYTETVKKEVAAAEDEKTRVLRLLLLGVCEVKMALLKGGAA